MTKYVGVQEWELARHRSCRRSVYALGRALVRADPTHVRQVECYNRRLVSGGKSGDWSLHAVGRALDIYPTSPEHLLRIAGALVQLAPVLGVQEVIVGDRRWTNGKWRRYKGTYHSTHVHASFTVAMADAAATDAELERWCSLWWIGAVSG